MCLLVKYDFSNLVIYAGENIVFTVFLHCSLPLHNSCLEVVAFIYLIQSVLLISHDQWAEFGYHSCLK